MLQWTWECRPSLWYPDFSFSGCIPKSGIAVSHGWFIFNFEENCYTIFCEQLYHFTFPPAKHRSSSFSTSSLPLIFVLLLFWGMTWHLVVLICIMVSVTALHGFIGCLCVFFGEIQYIFYDYLTSLVLTSLLFSSAVTYICVCVHLYDWFYLCMYYYIYLFTCLTYYHS